MADEKFDIRALKNFENKISASEGVEIKWFLSEIDRLFRLERSIEDINNFRCKKDKWKKFAAEVVVVFSHFKFQKISKGRIRFPLDDGFPDCWVKLSGEKDWYGLEVTAASARYRVEENKELKEYGHVRGLPPLSDEKSKVEFGSYMEQTQTPGMCEIDDYHKAISKGIQTCICKKNNTFKKHMNCGFSHECDLLIDVEPYLFTPKKYDAMIEELRKNNQDAKPRHIYLVSYGGKEEYQGYQIK